jgi:hypothetical protein
MQVDELLHNGETESGALVAAIERVIDLSDGLERDRDILSGHADAGVADLDDEIALLDACADDPPRRRLMFD